MEKNYKDKQNIPERMQIFEEFNEYNDETRETGKRIYGELREHLKKIQSENRTRKVAEGKTQRIGQTEETEIVNEFWNYYSQFTSHTPPDPTTFITDNNETAELKINVLIRKFKDFYTESIYPYSASFPIIHYSFRTKKNKMEEQKALIYIVGDTHGSFKDVKKLITLFSKKIEEEKKKQNTVKIIFVGDYVDRNPWDIHNMLYLMTFNLKYPRNVLLLRGNHEEMSINSHYGFGERVKKDLSKLTFAEFNDAFSTLPLIASLKFDKGNIMILHGGIPLIPNKNNPRQYEVPHLLEYEFKNRTPFLEQMDGLTQQILWNDPILRYDAQQMEPYYDSRRGLGFEFGKEVFEEFCKKNQVDLVFRGHQVFRDGYHAEFEGRFITIFSASQYVGMDIDSKFIELRADNIFNYKIRRILELPG